MDKQYGTETKCPKHKQGHEPDWRSLSISYDGDQAYVDVACKHCGGSGCVGSTDTLKKDLAW